MLFKVGDKIKSTYFNNFYEVVDIKLNNKKQITDFVVKNESGNLSIITNNQYNEGLYCKL